MKPGRLCPVGPTLVFAAVSGLIGGACQRGCGTQGSGRDRSDGAIPTLPVDLSEWTASITGDLEGDDDAETTRASQAALRRWADGR